MFPKLRKDCSRYGGRKPTVLRIVLTAVSSAGFRAVALYRLGYWCRAHRLRLLAAVLERVMHHTCHCWISTAAHIDEGFLVSHVCGIGVGPDTIIGKNCDIRRNVVFGGNYGRVDKQGRQKPTLGDNVSVGVGAVIVGPVKVGSRAIIGANSVVTRDVPENMIVSGIPAVVLHERWDECTGRKPEKY